MLLQPLGPALHVRPFGRPASRAGDARRDATGRKNMQQLIQLRWFAVAGQIATICVVRFALEASLPLASMGAVLALLVGANLLSLVLLRRETDISNAEIFAFLIVDVLALFAQLAFSGGVANPFRSLFLLQVTLSAVLLEAWSTWAIVALASGCLALLTLAYRPLPLDHFGPLERARLQMAGEFAAFVLDASLLVVFLTRIGRNLRTRDARLAALRQQAAEEDHIVRMGLLASGAAHELGTPLATLAVILNDWKGLPPFRGDPERLQEIEDMEEEVLRCKAIVNGILLSAGEDRGEGPALTSVRAFVDSAVAEWRTVRPPSQFSFSNEFGEDLPIVADPALKQVLFNVLDNATEASPGWVGLRVQRANDHLVFAVSDDGPGFSPEMLETFGKPYHSSKHRSGSGLGLFLVVNAVRKLGGVVIPRNRVIGGAEVIIRLPLAALALASGG
jgi:two-component system, sensor histidine kinase RegB